jgi:hypothetical protein
LKKARLLPAADEFGSGIDNFQSPGKGMMNDLADQMTN